MANLLYKNRKIYKKIHELSKEIQQNIELLDQEERKKQQIEYPNHTQYPNQTQIPTQNSTQNIILTIKDNESIVIKKESHSSNKITTSTTNTSKQLNHEKPPAGRVGTKWDPTIIHWKNSLRGYYFF